MLFEYSNLFIGYIVLVVLFLLILVRSNLNNWFKIIFIPILIWYGLFVYYTPQQFLGYSTTEDIKFNSIVYSYRIVEPSKTSKGGIYFWVIPPPEKPPTLLERVDPRKGWKRVISGILRAYVIPYSRKLHKQLLQAQQKKKGMKGASILIFGNNGKENSKGGKKDGDRFNKGRGKFQLVNPQILLKKDQNK